jgi:hypothetical protein
MAWLVPDVEGAVRTWLRSLPAVTALVGDRVKFALDPRSELPAVIVRLVGVVPDTSEAPLFQRILQVDVFDAARQKTRCFAVAAAVEAAFGSIRQATAMGSDVVAWGAEVQSVIYLPDPGNAAPRYSITVIITARSTAAV